MINEQALLPIIYMHYFSYLNHPHPGTKHAEDTEYSLSPCPFSAGECSQSLRVGPCPVKSECHGGGMLCFMGTCDENSMGEENEKKGIKHHINPLKAF